jgi:hypothetical protein
MKLTSIITFCALAVSLAALPAHAKAPTGPPAGTVPGVDRCVDLFFNEGGILQVRNHCVSTIYVLWFFNKIPGGHQLALNESISTGRDRGNLEKYGQIKYYACPVDHDHFLDANGKGIQDATVTTYQCGVTEKPFR